VGSSAGAGERFQLLDTLEWVYHARNGLATQEVSDESPGSGSIEVRSFLR
jgi:hypothetical protein